MTNTTEVDEVQQAALDDLAKGYQVIPMPVRSKNPCRKAWQQERRTLVDVKSDFSSEANISRLNGEPSEGLMDVDLDAAEAVDLASEFLPGTSMIHGRASKPRSHYWYICDPSIKTAKWQDVDGAVLLEVRGSGTQTVIPPSVHPEGEKYEWAANGEPAQADAEQLLRACTNTAICALMARNWPAISGHRHDLANALAGFLLRRGVDDDIVIKIVMTAAKVAGDEEWLERGNTARHTAGKMKTGAPVTGGPKVSEFADGGQKVISKIDLWLRNIGFVQSENTADQDLFDPAVSLTLTDTGNAKRFVGLFGEDVRYYPQLRKWFVWDGRRWAEDERHRVIEFAKETANAIYKEAGDKATQSWAKQSQNKPRLHAMVTLAESESDIPVLPDDLDADPWALNVINGTVDLKTGKLRPPIRTDLITKLAPVKFDPHARCPRFLAFLRKIMNKNANLTEFLQKATGYALTGSSKEQVVLFLYGTGQNGKTTFIESIRSCFGDYAKQTPMSTFLSRRTDATFNDLARLQGSRFVSASEVDEGKTLSEVTIKQVSGGDTITARYLFKEFFEYRPQFKVFMAVNHKPNIAGTDFAIWRRIRLIPFDVTITEDEKDEDLPQKLRDELPGILNWALEGCLKWQREGLGVPEEIAKATGSYRSEMDVLDTFVKDCCEEGQGLKEGSTALYEEYRSWCIQNGEETLSQKKLAPKLRERGYEDIRVKGGRNGWTGLRIRAMS